MSEDERRTERHQAYEAGYFKGRADENEACAKVAERTLITDFPEEAGRIVAERIRARMEYEWQR